jgi:hypothetical protein
MEEKEFAELFLQLPCVSIFLTDLRIPDKYRVLGGGISHKLMRYSRLTDR